eukprot:CAMPEP_0167810084 /NCGR_PEP_ID=MMETSP0111_2-20121227/24171_1 /TAXON_ID=91324 /ORGANISM="Lotharella globosa, Strain CCCM811" /LENGTH=100 /DNA_ID=CAMNT_0007708577 /DNA_START=229 /DNA_END=527 /DNA_ORIENTATION=-
MASAASAASALRGHQVLCSELLVRSSNSSSTTTRSTIYSSSGGSVSSIERWCTQGRWRNVFVIEGCMCSERGARPGALLDIESLERAEGLGSAHQPARPV